MYSLESTWSLESTCTHQLLPPQVPAPIISPPLSACSTTSAFSHSPPCSIAATTLPKSAVNMTQNDTKMTPK